jgi:hypothetical protein
VGVKGRGCLLCRLIIRFVHGGHSKLERLKLLIFVILFNLIKRKFLGKVNEGEEMILNGILFFGMFLIREMEIIY